MEEKENIKISISTFFLIIAVVVIIIMGVIIYKISNDKMAEIQKSEELQTKVNTLNETVNQLQEKIIDSMSETTNGNSTSINATSTNNSNNSNSANVTSEDEIKYDFEISMSELENVNKLDSEQIYDFEEKYAGKTVKVTGYVTNFGDDDIEIRKNICEYRK